MGRYATVNETPHKVLKFSATWCGPCKSMTQTIQNLGTLPITIEEVDIDTNSELAQTYSIRGVPTLVMLNEDGKEIKRSVGALTVQDLKKWLGV